MVNLFSKGRYSPIGIDFGSRSVKLVQLSADRTRVVEAVRWELPRRAPEQRDAQLADFADALRLAREGHNFHGRDAVICLGANNLFVQNIRVPKAPPQELDKVVKQEAAGRLPYSITEAEIRYIDAADVRQGDSTKREVILLACHRPELAQLLSMVDAAGLNPIAVDVEPVALVRCYTKQFRRDEDQELRAMFVHVGASNSAVIIARGDDVLFVKYVDVGGRHMDEAVATHLYMAPAEAAMLRRQSADRRADSLDPEVARTLSLAIRPVVDRLASELAMCLRYHSVTFRGQPVVRYILGGGEACPSLQEALSERLNAKCELGDPLRTVEGSTPRGPRAQWDVATGLAMRELN